MLFPAHSQLSSSLKSQTSLSFLWMWCIHSVTTMKNYIIKLILFTKVSLNRDCEHWAVTQWKTPWISHQKEFPWAQIRVLGLILEMRWGTLTFRTPSLSLSVEIFWRHPNRRRPQGRPITCWRDYISNLAWDLLGFPQENWRSWLGRRMSVQLCLVCCHKPHLK